ncbi:MAG: magnesium chelatase [Dehalococcoidia bacterium]|jgi:magnesium chelatase subunit I
MMTDRPKTLGELRASGYRAKPVREEMRDNLIRKIRGGQTLFPGLIGFDDSVLPHLENAILAGQDVILLGERGQAKSRLIRQLVELLDEAVPAVAGCEINDDPFAPICRACRDRAVAEGDDVPIVWLTPDERYGEKLATPDITIADLIGEIDPIKVAEGRYLSDELTIHYGLVPRSNRGIFSINELPDLAERIQVGLLNIMEERDVQIRGYRVRLPLDVFIVASANPEDYTNRGRIITPLKDRFGAQIRTHYPRTVDDEIGIMEQEARPLPKEAKDVFVPQYMKEIVAEITRLARRSPDVNQRSGVSVRASITDYETLLSNALRRAIRLDEKEVVPRISDLYFLMPALSGKIEFETLDEGREEQILEKLIAAGVLAVFNRSFNLDDLDETVAGFKGGLVVETSDLSPAGSYVALLQKVPGLERSVAHLKVGERPAAVASAVEFVLEGLHLNKRLNKDRVSRRAHYRG